jgi:Protein of unknown function (DUF4232)
MTRSTIRPLKALWAITVVAAVIALTASPASARPSASGLTASPYSGTASCQASDLRISVPSAMAGDPAEGMGKRAWNVVFRNIVDTACSLRGWPRILVRTIAGKTVATSISDVEYNNLALIPDAKIVLGPGQSAVVTAMSASAASGCVTKWMLGLTLPGAHRPVTVREPASSFVPCVGGQLRLSPFYAEQTLTSEINAMKVSTVPPPFSPVTTAEPPRCNTRVLHADITSVASEDGGSIIELQLRNSGGVCVLPEGWPTVRVVEAGGASQVAKIFPDTAAVRAGRSLLTTYERGTTQSTALTLQPGGSVSFALFAAGKGPGPRVCPRVTSVTVYPSAIARGTGSVAPLTTKLSMCGSPRVLSFLPDQPGGMDMNIARAALDIVRAHPARTMSDGDSAGFYYGTDSSAPTACGGGKGPYTEPDGYCGNGTEGPYGEYIGEIGSFMNWKGCTTSGLAWAQANYNMANDNVIKYSTGLGAAAYWFAAGPGRDPRYNGTTSEATIWGEEQAQQAISDLDGDFLNFRYIFMDIENNGSPPDEDGWNTVWNGPCGSTAKAEYIPANVDYATYQGFADYINAHSPYTAGVYSAGGDYYGSWTGIFGSEHLSNAAEWTFTNEQSELDFPSGFSGSNASADWFATAPATCHLMWQWSGGNGVLNGYGDLDQAEQANDANHSC